MSGSNKTIKNLMLIIIVAIILVIIGVVYHQKFHKTISLPKPVTIDTKNQPTIGNPNAKIHIIAFEDLKCVNCARFNNNLFPYIKKTFIDTNKAKYTLINLAFINGSLPAAIAARCVYQHNEKLFFPYVEYIFAHQPPENEDWANIPKLLDMASQIPDLDINALTNCLSNNNYQLFIKDNLKIAEKAMGGNAATPTVFINGVIVRPLTKERFNAVMQAVE